MVDQPAFIVDQQLPDAQNFGALKNLAIKQLKELAGDSWTNYNDTDPGVTILDQLCYALTELGYCASFPIEDVLTGADGKIDYDRQFFAPQDILTSSPITIDDYRRLAHDRLQALEAIYIVAEPYVCASQKAQPGQPVFTGRYHIYLSAKAGAPAEEAQCLGASVQALLNNHRNLGELFCSPTPLTPKTICLAGTITLEPSADPRQVNVDMLAALGGYLAPPAVRRGYQELRAQGVDADLIFNGPRMEQGWISGPGALGAKRDSVNLTDLNLLLARVVGVARVEGLAFKDGDAGQDAVHIDTTAIARIDLRGVSIMCQGVAVVLPQPQQPQENSGVSYLSEVSRSQRGTSVGAKVDRHPPLPQGNYRNIEQYYSVQNTFPDTYGIGHNSLRSDASSYRVASARQLKGYLMVYDQLLANQFSQLAHVGELFSFKPPKQQSAYGATYYCQPLYAVPDVMPLLSGNGAFSYQLDPTEAAPLVERDAWRRYQKQPFNDYLRGLRDMMEQQSGADSRRDRMLSHLMARHGDQAGLYETMMTATHWYGSAARTRVVVKSIWLQNFPLLSYARARAPGGWTVDKDVAAPGARRLEVRPAAPAYPTIDGELDEAAVYAAACVQQVDLDYFSAFELKANILLGLSAHLQALAGKLNGLLEQADFRKFVDSGTDNYALKNSDLHVYRATSGKHVLKENRQELMEICGVQGAAVEIDDYLKYLAQLRWLADVRQGALLIEHQLLLPEKDPGTPWYFLNASLALPDYVTLFRQPNFASFLDTLIAQHWPAHVGLTRLYCSQLSLALLIPRFIAWHNASPADPAKRAALTLELATCLRSLPKEAHAN
jgi:hypothetical protein